MNHIVSHPDRLFVDRPLTNQPGKRGQVSSLRLLCQDKTDYTEAALRLFLMLSIPVSLLLCGMKVSATSETQPSARIQGANWSAACLAPTIPKVQINALVR